MDNEQTHAGLRIRTRFPLKKQEWGTRRVSKVLILFGLLIFDDFLIYTFMLCAPSNMSVIFIIFEKLYNIFKY